MKNKDAMIIREYYCGRVPIVRLLAEAAEGMT